MCVHGQTQHDLLEVADAFPRAHRQGEGGPWWSQVSWGGVTVAGSGMAGWLHSFSADVLQQGESSA